MAVDLAEPRESCQPASLRSCRDPSAERRRGCRTRCPCIDRESVPRPLLLVGRDHWCPQGRAARSAMEGRRFNGRELGISAIPRRGARRPSSGPDEDSAFAPGCARCIIYRSAQGSAGESDADGRKDRSVRLLAQAGRDDPLASELGDEGLHPLSKGGRTPALSTA